MIPALFVIIGIYSTAKAEEELLIEKFGEEYKEYKMWLVIIRNVRTVIMTSNEDIIIPELGFDNI